ncbi:MAG: hypothetical protein MRK02_14670 [Candidatus Scalindua sp.]|nr:hypothetical protein [Candidatus Scalindua sp.]
MNTYTKNKSDSGHLPVHATKQTSSSKGKLIVVEGIDGSGKTVQTRILEKRLMGKGYRVQMTDFPQYGKSFFADMIEKYLKGEFGWPKELREHLKKYPLPTEKRDEPGKLLHDSSLKIKRKDSGDDESDIGKEDTLSGSVVPRAEEVNPYLSSLLYAGDRWEIKEQMIRWLDEGFIITSNRYVCSNMAHQGAKIRSNIERNRFFKWIKELEYKVYAIPKPDLIVYLHVPIEVSQRLIMERFHSLKGVKTEIDIHEKDLKYLHEVQKVYGKLAEEDDSWFQVECAKNSQILTREEISEKVWGIVNRILP